MGKIRIIGGIHRSRQLPVLNAPGLRPTLDRVKETLFNWLGQDLTGLSCLDLFAGSGSLGFEAVSRNASQVVMVEKDAKVARQLFENVKLLKADNCQVSHEDAFGFLKHNRQFFDVVFLDPPYSSDYLARSLVKVSKYLKPGGRIYIEYVDKPDLSGYELLKEGTAGKINYVLIGLISNI